MARRTRGTIRKLPSGRWQARVWDDGLGTRVNGPRTFTTKADASRWLAAVETGAIKTAGLRPTTEVPRFGEYAEAWLAARPLRPRTRILYRSQLDRHLLPNFGAIRLNRVDPAMVRKWFGEVSSSHLSQVTVAKLYRLLRTILTTAVEDELIERNPCQIRHAGVERSAERPIPPVAVVERLAAGLPDRYAAVPWIAALAGLRRSEIFALARCHVDLAGGTLRVERSIQEHKGEGFVFTPPKTASSVRTVALPATLVAVLEAHLERFVADDPDSLLFTNEQGRPVRAVTWTPAWKAAQQAAGVQVRLHDLRHLAGTLTAQAGATLKETMHRLGHSTSQAALRYQHVVESRAVSIAEAIDRLVASTDEPS